MARLTGKARAEALREEAAEALRRAKAIEAREAKAERNRELRRDILTGQAVRERALTDSALAAAVRVACDESIRGKADRALLGLPPLADAETAPCLEPYPVQDETGSGSAA